MSARPYTLIVAALFVALALSRQVSAQVAGNYWAPGAGGGGNGTWGSSSDVWATAAGSQGTSPQAASGTLIFGGTAGTVTVIGNVSAVDGLGFSATGYTVRSNTITLSGENAAANTITTDASVGATINSVLDGSAGMTKAGSGTLTLGGVNTFTGGIVIDDGALLMGAGTASVQEVADPSLGQTNRTFAIQNLNTATAEGNVEINSGPTGFATATAMAAAFQAHPNYANLPYTITANEADTGLLLTFKDAGVADQRRFAKYGDHAVPLTVLTAGSPAGSFDPADALVINTSGTFDLAGQTQAFASLSGGGALVMDGGSFILAGASSSTFDGTLHGTGTFEKTGTGTVTLSGASTFTGSTAVNGGTLVVDGSISDSTVTINNGGTLSGSGSVGGIVLNLGGTISPGNSPDTQSVTGNVVWNAGGNYNWEIYDATGGAGTGWDLISASGTLDLSALTVGSEFNINLWSLQSIGPDVTGDAINFDPSQNYTWTILTAAGGITGYTGTDQFIINTAAFNGTGGFSNLLNGGTFSILQSGNDLNLVFASAPIPEPGTWAAAALLVGGAAFVRWRRRK